MKPNRLPSSDISIVGLTICIIASSYTFFDFFIQVAPSVMTEQLMSALQFGPRYLGIMGACFYFAYAMMQIPSGYSIDKWGAKKILLIYSFLAGVSCLLFSLTTNYSVLVLSRILAGVSVCIGFLACYSLVSQWLPHRYFSTSAAILHLLGALGAILAQGPLAKMVNQLGWRETMQYLSLIGFILFLCYFFGVRDNNQSNRDDDTRLQQQFMKSFKYCISHTQVIWIAICGFLGWLPVSIIGALWGVPYFMDIFGWDNVSASKLCSFFWVGSAVGAFMLCWLSEYLNSRKIPLYLAFVLSIGSSISIIMASKLGLDMIKVALFMLGVSVCMQTLSFCIIKENVEPSHFTSAAGMNNVGAMLSGVFGQYIIGFLLEIFQAHEALSKYSFQYAFLILPIAGTLGLVISIVKVNETNCLCQYRK